MNKYRPKISARLFTGIALATLLVGAGFAWFILDPGFGVTRDKPVALADAPKNEFERRVREYLLNNPEVIVESMQRLQTRQRRVQQQGAQSVLKSRSEEIFRDPASPTGGESGW